VEELERAAALAGREGKAEVKDGKVLIKCHSQVSPRDSFWTRRRGGGFLGWRRIRRGSWTDKVRANVRYMSSHSTRNWGTSRRASGLTRTEVCLMSPGLPGHKADA
jgi:soluble lytic murein transglycosylase-like protein